mmetsp:Transcript_18106/g.28839  ORF Transcript_18106/g.28839 Transcript_18106/m.28839 type:complete len:236 (-) Transcript_18106:48-755(-)
MRILAIAATFASTVHEVLARLIANRRWSRISSEIRRSTRTSWRTPVPEIFRIVVTVPAVPSETSPHFEVPTHFPEFVAGIPVEPTPFKAPPTLVRITEITPTPPIPSIIVVISLESLDLTSSGRSSGRPSGRSPGRSSGRSSRRPSGKPSGRPSKRSSMGSSWAPIPGITSSGAGRETRTSTSGSLNDPSTASVFVFTPFISRGIPVVLLFPIIFRRFFGFSPILGSGIILVCEE